MRQTETNLVSCEWSSKASFKRCSHDAAVLGYTKEGNETLNSNCAASSILLLEVSLEKLEKETQAIEELILGDIVMKELHLELSRKIIEL